MNLGKRILAMAAASATVALALTGCASNGVSGPTDITVWAMCSEVGEIAAIKEQVDAFNKEYKGTITATLECKSDMGTTLKTTKAANLPEVFEFDGETLAALAYAGKVAKLNGVIKQDVLDNELVSIQAEGTYRDGNTYSVSQYDSGLALYGNRAMLEEAGISDIPTTWDAAWTADQFGEVLAKLAAVNPEGKALDIKENYGLPNGWPGYAFTPIVNSAGYPLIGSDGKAEGSLDAPAVVAAIEQFMSWKQYVDPSADDKAFTEKRVGLSWVGHWMYPAHKAALGSDLVVIPLPDFGMGTKSGQGSHSWAMGSKASGDKQKAAVLFLEFIMQDKYVLGVAKQNGAVPATTSALAQNELYQPGGDLELYGQQLAASCGSGEITKDCVTVPRTISPAWPVINTKFSEAFAAIYGGADAQTELTKAAKAIDQDSADNNGYQD